jgi:hypothetical protein
VNRQRSAPRTLAIQMLASGGKTLLPSLTQSAWFHASIDRSTPIPEAHVMKYTVRIELLDATPDDYATLSKALRYENFEHTVPASEGTRFRLPPGEYNYDAKATATDVIEAAKRAAGTTGREFRVLVTEVAARAWHNLEIEAS